MRFYNCLALAAALLAAAGCQQQTPATGTGEMTTVSFNVPDMMCENSCVPDVRQTLAGQPGVQKVDVVLETKTATVVADKSIFDADAAVAALKDHQFVNTSIAVPGQPAAGDTAPAEDSAPPAADEPPAENS
jgi:copper chaperone CopZ